MIACVVGFVFFKRFYRDLGDVFIFLVVLGTLFSVYYNFRSIRKDPIFIAFFISIIIPVISWANSKIQIPELAKDLPSPFLFYDFFSSGLFHIGLREKTNESLQFLLPTALALSVFI